MNVYRNLCCVQDYLSTIAIPVWYCLSRVIPFKKTQKKMQENPNEVLIEVIYWRIQSVIFKGVRATSAHFRLLLIEEIFYTFFQGSLEGIRLCSQLI